MNFVLEACGDALEACIGPIGVGDAHVQSSLCRADGGGENVGRAQIGLGDESANFCYGVWVDSVDAVEDALDDFIVTSGGLSRKSTHGVAAGGAEWFVSAVRAGDCLGGSP